MSYLQPLYKNGFSVKFSGHGVKSKKWPPERREALLKFQDDYNVSVPVLLNILKGEVRNKAYKIPDILKNIPENDLPDVKTIYVWRNRYNKDNLSDSDSQMSLESPPLKEDIFLKREKTDEKQDISVRRKKIYKREIGLRFIEFYDNNIFKNNFDLDKTLEDFEAEYGKRPGKVNLTWIKKRASCEDVFLSFVRRHDSLHPEKSSKRVGNNLSERENFLLEQYNKIYNTNITVKNALKWLPQKYYGLDVAI